MGSFVDSISTALQSPFLIPLMREDRMYWLYLLSAGVLAYWVYLRRRARKPDEGRGFLSYLFPKSIYGHRSARTDYLFVFVNKILFFVLLAPSLLSSYAVAETLAHYLRPIFPGLVRPEAVAGFWPILFHTFLVALALDFALFIAHYWTHKIPLLWEFHKVHHSAEVLTPITGYRMHPIEDLLVLVTSVTLVGVVDCVFLLAYPGGIPVFTYAELNIFFFAFYFLGYNLRHSHVWLDYGPILSRLFISPAQHQIHHSTNPKHFDKNMGFIFAFWDWMFGTLYIPRKEEEDTIQFGIGKGEEKEYQSVSRLYFLPFKKAWRRFQRPPKRGAEKDNSGIVK